LARCERRGQLAEGLRATTPRAGHHLLRCCRAPRFRQGGNGRRLRTAPRVKAFRFRWGAKCRIDPTASRCRAWRALCRPFSQPRRKRPPSGGRGGRGGGVQEARLLLSVLDCFPPLEQQRAGRRLVRWPGWACSREPPVRRCCWGFGFQPWTRPGSGLPIPPRACQAGRARSGIFKGCRSSNDV
jgi:hypothetical protein